MEALSLPLVPLAVAMQQAQQLLVMAKSYRSSALEQIPPRALFLVLLIMMAQCILGLFLRLV